MPIARFEMPDGRIARFEVPDGTTPEQAHSLMQAHFAQPSAPTPAPAPKEEHSLLDNIVGGAVKGASRMGVALLTPVDAAARKLGIQNDWIGRTDRAESIDQFMTDHADPNSLAFKGADIGTQVAGTAGVGGAIAAPLKAAANVAGRFAPAVSNLAEATASGGFKAGTATGLAGAATRALGGGTAAAGATALTNPEDTATGAIVGAVLPVGLQAAGKVAGVAGRTLKAAAQPFTENGQSAIAANIIRKFAGDGSTAIDARQLVPGSLPTLAEATDNAGVAGLQRAVRALPTATDQFVQREALNDAARGALFDDVAGDAGKLAFFRADRAQAADDLYGKALDPASQQELTPYLKGQITQLLKRPSVNEARKVAQQWAIERGEKPTAEGSMRALHDIKTALDDKIAQAVQGNQGGQVKALEATKNKLLQVMEKISPDYAAARTTYAEMSGPINAMETLQGLRLTDKRGNMTLAKVKNAIEGLERQRRLPGVNNAKSVTDEQLASLYALRDDLLRADGVQSGLPVNSATLQNISTNNLLESMLPGPLASAIGPRVGTLVGQAGQLLYNKPNEAIRSKLVDMVLNPQEAQAALQRQQGGTTLTHLLDRLSASSALPAGYRAAPVLTAPALSSSP